MMRPLKLVLLIHSSIIHRIVILLTLNQRTFKRRTDFFGNDGYSVREKKRKPISFRHQKRSRGAFLCLERLTYVYKSQEKESMLTRKGVPIRDNSPAMPKKPTMAFNSSCHVSSIRRNKYIAFNRYDVI